MASPINSSNWAGPNCAGSGRVTPGVADDGTGLTGTLYGGDGTLGKVYTVAGPNAAGAAPTNVTTAGQPMTGQIS